MSGPLRASLMAVSVLALTGCGTSASDAVKAKVQQFARATRIHDYKTICSEVLAPDLIGRLRTTGVSCERAMQIALGSVQDPTLSVGKVTITGSSAAAIVLSVARNQEASLSTIKLTNTSGGWRIAALSSPVGGPG